MPIPLIAVLCLVLAAWARGEEYVPSADSLPQEGVPQGAVTQYAWDSSSIYPDAIHDYWVYVPAQYTGAEAACVMVFQDGQAYVHADGPVRAPTVFDNLIHRGEMPVTIGIFINPGRREDDYDQRSAQYVPLSDAYARFLLEEILPEVGKHYNLAEDADSRAIGGMSDGGLASFTAAWERPDAFSKVVSHIGSYTRLRGGSEYPYLIRKTRENPKPIRVFLQDGSNDLNLTEGNWTLANLSMASALMFARYDYRFELGTGGHDLQHGGAIFPDTMRWIWRDYPGVKGGSVASSPDAVVGRWNIVTNVLGKDRHSALTISRQGDALAAKLDDDEDGEIEIAAINFGDSILTYEYEPPPESDLNWAKLKGGDKESSVTLSAWLKVAGDTLEGALSTLGEMAFDYAVKGKRSSKAAD